METSVSIGIFHFIVLCVIGDFIGDSMDSESKNTTTIEISKKTRVLLKMYCIDNEITYDNAIETLIQTTKLDINENAIDLLNLFCQVKRVSASEAIIQLIKREIKEVVITKVVDDQGHIIESITENHE